MNTQEYIDLENKYVANIYNPMPVVLERGRGVYVWDVEGRRYIDCLAGYSCLSLGHNHPRIIQVAREQMEKGISVVSRAFREKDLVLFAEKICKQFGAERVLPMNSGAEAVETAIKVARKWGMIEKKIPDGAQKIIVCDGNFHGRTTTIISFSPNENYKKGFGPLTPGFYSIPYNNPEALESVIEYHTGCDTVAFLVEPLQGEGGMRVPSQNYFNFVRELCDKYNILLILDEVQTGLGRTGSMLAEEHSGIKADITLLGKALGGGILPISVVLDRKGGILDVLQPGDHGSTFGGNPLACKVAMETLDIIEEENLVKNSFERGLQMREGLNRIWAKNRLIKDVRGLGLMTGVELTIPARPICEKLMKYGVLCYYTSQNHSQALKQNILRLTPPLIITKEEVEWVVEAVDRCLAIQGEE